MDSYLSRRDFLKLAGALGGTLALWGPLAACTPQYQNQYSASENPESILEKAGMNELSEFYNLTTQLRGIFGKKDS